MPSIDVDYKSIGHHAAGIFLGNGHRRAVWIVPEARHAGNIETEQSFIEAFNNSHHRTEPCRIVRCTSSRDSLIQKLDQLPPETRAPTAFFVMESFATTTLVTYLLERGRRIPADASIITRDYDELLRWISPDIAHYMPPLRRIAARISRMVVDIVDGIPLPIDPVRMMPDFRKGDSIGRCEESPKTLRRSSLTPSRPRGAKPPALAHPNP
jgi:LacI family transcriptional regulator